MEKTFLNITPGFGYICCPSALSDTNSPTDAKGRADDLIAERVFDITVVSCTSEATSRSATNSCDCVPSCGEGSVCFEGEVFPLPVTLPC